MKLRGVTLRPKGTARLAVRLDEVRVDLDGLTPSGAFARGGAVTLDGALEDVRRDLEAWKGADPGGSTNTGAALPIHASELDVDWTAPAMHVHAGGASVVREAGETEATARDLSVFLEGQAGGKTELQATGARVSKRDDAWTAFAENARIVQGAVVAEASGGEATVAHGAVESIRAKAATVSFALPEPKPPAPAPVESVFAVKAKAVLPPSPAPARVPPLLPFPDLRALQERALTVAKLLAQKLPARAKIDVEAFTLKLSREGAALSLGPGPLALARIGEGSGERIDVTLSTRASPEAPPLVVHAVLPTSPGEVRAELDGGPVPLSLLAADAAMVGVSELDKGTIEGHARLLLPASADALSFDGSVVFRGISVENKRLATGVVRGLDVGVRAKGSLFAAGALRLDDADFSLGKLHVAVRGSFEQKPDHLGADLALELPREDCQALVMSLPAAFVPNMAGTTWSGTLEGHVRFAFDSRKVDDLTLDYAFKDGCKIEGLPPHLQKERFTRPFAYTFYAPDATPREGTTGPGTRDWTPLAQMSRFLPIAVLMTEDGGVYRNYGFNHPQIKLAVVTNIKERRFARGASTLIMQLAKNLFQHRDKTIARKLEQVILTEYISQTFTKNEVLELYLNLVEFGPNVYGVKEAAQHYFGKAPSWLTLKESIVLASMLPAPTKFHTLMYNLPDAYWDSYNHWIDLTRVSHLVTDEEAEKAKGEGLAFVGGWHSK